MADDRRYDVIIIGYGPVGATAANLLGPTGLRVLVVERDRDIYTRARAISTDEEVLRIWQQTGLAERLEADMLHERPIDCVDDRGRSFLTLTPRTRGNGHPPQLFIYQPALEQVLRDGVGRYPNVEVRLGHEASDLRQDDRGVELTVTEVATGAATTVTGSWVIAADGGSSPTRTALKVGFEGRTYEDRWIVIDTKMREPWPHHDRLRFHCDPERPAVDCPTPLDHHRWEFPVLPDDNEDQLTSDRGVWDLLGRHGITPSNVEVLRAVVYNHHVRFAARWRDGRVFLAGDAAHVMPPWIGQGMAAGVRDVANLSWKLTAVIRGELPLSVLDSYERERQPHVRTVTRRAVALGKVITERRRTVASLRNIAGRVVMATPFLGAWVRNGEWFPSARHEAGFYDSLTRRSAVGAMPPQPMITVGDRTGLLDDIIGPGWVMLTTADHADLGAWATTGIPVHEVTVQPTSDGTALVDSQGLLTGWMARHHATVLVLRPDRFVYTADGARPLAAPPAGFHPLPAQELV